jgi:hypothetical protein
LASRRIVETTDRFVAGVPVNHSPSRSSGNGGIGRAAAATMAGASRAAEASKVDRTSGFRLVPTNEAGR